MSNRPRRRVMLDMAPGHAVVIRRDVLHSKGSENGGTVVMVQMFDLEPGFAEEGLNRTRWSGLGEHPAKIVDQSSV